MGKEELKNRLRTALDINDKRPADLCRDLNLAKSTVSQYLSGKSKHMDADRLQNICEYLNVSEAWMMGYDVPMERRMISVPALEQKSLTPDETDLLGHYQKLNPAGKSKVREYAADLTEQQKYMLSDSEASNVVENAS